MGNLWEIFVRDVANTYILHVQCSTHTHLYHMYIHKIHFICKLYIYTYIFTRIYIYNITCIYIYICTYRYMYMYTCVYICTYKHTCIHPFIPGNGRFLEATSPLLSAKQSCFRITSKNRPSLTLIHLEET